MSTLSASSQKALTERLGEFEVVPLDYFQVGTLGHGIQNGNYMGATFDYGHAAQEVTNTCVMRQPGASMSSPQWCVFVEFLKNGGTGFWDRPSWSDLDSRLILPASSKEQVQHNFNAISSHTPNFTERFLRAAAPDVRPNTFPAWLENDFVNACKQRHPFLASAESPKGKAFLYCESLSLRSDGLYTGSATAQVRFEVHPVSGTPLLREQEVLFGWVYPEAFLAPVPNKQDLDVYFLDIEARLTKRLQAVLKKVDRVLDEEWTPHDVCGDQVPIICLQKHLKIESIFKFDGTYG